VRNLCTVFDLLDLLDLLDLFLSIFSGAPSVVGFSRTSIEYSRSGGGWTDYRRKQTHTSTSGQPSYFIRPLRRHCDRAVKESINPSCGTQHVVGAHINPGTVHTKSVFQLSVCLFADRPIHVVICQRLNAFMIKRQNPGRRVPIQSTEKVCAKTRSFVSLKGACKGGTCPTARHKV